ncbi:MBOAT family O-acyltransferase [Bacillus sp. 1P06AnD]|uniref:MBOAT family O-acyltransferase n=1 Tax=Bacillus sp. 1P06AnD TaxID=3132208 RepID=UPI0039A0C2FC
MIFSSLTFLTYFLPLALALYYLSPKKFKNSLLLFISFFFYAWGEPIYILLMLISACADYKLGLKIEKERTSNGNPRFFLSLSLLFNIGLLCVFKYSDFIISLINNWIGTEIPFLHLPLPIGISFYTFQTMSYSIDLYRGKVKAQKNLLDFALYVSLFPQLIAGPIVRYESIASEIKERRHSMSLFSEGAFQFIIGLSKKVLIANNVGQLWTALLAGDFGELSTFAAWFGIIAFSLQIYFDFSGYSDMAIGLGKMFGFHFPQNFNYPYLALSLSDFWRRWHMTLGGWFRDYVYFPLGGSRKEHFVVVRNLFVVWFLTGLWHGASWNYIVWGLYFGVLIGCEKLFLTAFLKKLPTYIQRIYALFFIVIGWILFYFEKSEQGLPFLKTLFGLDGSPFFVGRDIYLLYSYGLICMIAVTASTPIGKYIASISYIQKNSWPPFLFCLILFILSLAYLTDQTYNPFLYFRF